MIDLEAMWQRTQDTDVEWDSQDVVELLEEIEEQRASTKVKEKHLKIATDMLLRLYKDPESDTSQKLAIGACLMRLGYHEELKQIGVGE